MKEGSWDMASTNRGRGGWGVRARSRARVGIGEVEDDEEDESESEDSVHFDRELKTSELLIGGKGRGVERCSYEGEVLKGGAWDRVA